MALSADRNTLARDGRDLVLPVSASTTVYAGGIVCIDGDGFAVPGATATTLKAVGVAQETVVNAGADGAKTVKVRRGVFQFANSASSDAIALTEYGSDCYIVDDATVAKTNGSSSRSVAGKVRGVDAAGVWVEF